MGVVRTRGTATTGMTRATRAALAAKRASTAPLASRAVATAPTPTATPVQRVTRRAPLLQPSSDAVARARELADASQEASCGGAEAGTRAGGGDATGAGVRPAHRWGAGAGAGDDVCGARRQGDGQAANVSRAVARARRTPANHATRRGCRSGSPLRERRRTCISRPARRRTRCRPAGCRRSRTPSSEGTRWAPR